MAQKVNITLVDDIDESDAEETVSFGLDGTTYEIDLNANNATSLRNALATYVAHGRKVTGSRRARRSGRAGGTDGPSATEMREWARSNGHEVSERGRVSAKVREAYEAAH